MIIAVAVFCVAAGFVGVPPQVVMLVILFWFVNRFSKQGKGGA